MGEALFSDAALESVGTLAETINTLTRSVRAHRAACLVFEQQNAELVGVVNTLQALASQVTSKLGCSVALADELHDSLASLQNAAFAVLPDAEFRRVMSVWADMAANRRAVAALLSGSERASGPAGESSGEQ
ncbi:MAG: hypothetical protein ACKVS9_00100 [Phycisphaerae bacterium]